MRITILFLVLLVAGCNSTTTIERKIFDVHLHGAEDPTSQLNQLQSGGVAVVAVSTSWQEQQGYKGDEKLKVLHGLFIPCPNGKVPYSLQPCFEDGKEWPDINWVEQQVKKNKIRFLGEVLTQYHGSSSSDSLMFPYYALAEKYNLPVGLHTGSAGSDHGCPNFKEEMGNPVLFREALARFPKLRAWFMHGGGPFLEECIAMMKEFPNVYADISVLNNPGIIPTDEFYKIMKELIDAGLEDRLLFGSDNAEIENCIASVENLDFLTEKQKQKIFYDNATVFFNE